MVKRSGSPLVVVAAGGTGGHLFPAEALAVALSRRGVSVDLVTDERASQYGEFPGHATHIVPSATFAGRNPFHIAGVTSKLCRGTIRALHLFGQLRPAAVVGFGVRASRFPSLMAGASTKICITVAAPSDAAIAAIAANVSSAIPDRKSTSANNASRK